MRRRLIKQGMKGNTVYLPKKWVDERGLKAGDEVEITEEEDALVISSAGKGKIRVKNISLEHFNRSQTRTVVSGAYKAGYNEINIHYTNKPNAKELNKIISTLTGLELISLDGNTANIRCFVNDSKEGIESLIVKMIQIVLNEAKDGDSKDYVDDLLNYRRLRDFLLREINMFRYGGENTHNYYDFVTQLEKVFELVIRIRKSMNDAKFIAKIVSLLEELYKIYIKNDFSGANKFRLKLAAIKQNDLDPSKLKKANTSIVYFNEFIERLIHLGSRIQNITA